MLPSCRGEGTRPGRGLGADPDWPLQGELHDGVQPKDRSRPSTLSRERVLHGRTSDSGTGVPTEEPHPFPLPWLGSGLCCRGTALACRMPEKSLGCCTSRTCWAALGCWQLLQGRCWMLGTACWGLG